MNRLEKAYADLTRIALKKPLNDFEQVAIQTFQKELGLTSCNECEGQGMWTMDFVGKVHECTHCEGLGEQGVSGALKKELKEIYKEHYPGIYREHFQGRN